MKTPKGLKLQKIKQLKSGGVEAEYTYTEEDNGQIFGHTIIHHSDKVPRMDLTNAINKLAPFLAATHGIGALAAVFKSEHLTPGQQKAAKTLEKVISLALGEQLKQVVVTGVALSGEENTRGVIITGGTEVKEKRTALNSPRIRLGVDLWGFEDKVSDIIETITHEVEQYFFKGKKAQPELFDEMNDDKQEAA